MSTNLEIYKEEEEENLSLFSYILRTIKIIIS
jgi:hypothetical protein